MPRANSFRLEAKRVLITWSQVPHQYTKDEWVSELERLVGDNGRTIRCGILAEETHGDGGKHFHAAIEFNERIRTRNPRVFDIHGVHPNIQKLASQKDFENAIVYCEKEDESPHYWGRDLLPRKKKTWAAIIEEASDANSFLESVAEHFPRDIVLNLERVQYYAQWKFAPQARPYTPVYPTDSFTNVPDEITAWAEEWLLRPDVNVSFFLTLLTTLTLTR